MNKLLVYCLQLTLLGYFTEPKKPFINLAYCSAESSSKLINKYGQLLGNVIDGLNFECAHHHYKTTQMKLSTVQPVNI